MNNRNLSLENKADLEYNTLLQPFAFDLVRLKRRYPAVHSELVKSSTSPLELCEFIRQLNITTIDIDTVHFLACLYSNYTNHK